MKRVKEKHIWIKNDYAKRSVDYFAFTEGEYHNGPKCKKCDFGFCEHCFPEGYETKCGTESLGSDDSKLNGGMIAMVQAMQNKFLTLKNKEDGKTRRT